MRHAQREYSSRISSLVSVSAPTLSQTQRKANKNTVTEIGNHTLPCKKLKQSSLGGLKKKQGKNIYVQIGAHKINANKATDLDRYLIVAE